MPRDVVRRRCVAVEKENVERMCRLYGMMARADTVARHLQHRGMLRVRFPAFIFQQSYRQL